MAAAYQWGYRMAMLVAGAVPLMLAGPFGWNVSFAATAALAGIGIAATLAAPREELQHAPVSKAVGIAAAFGEPLRDFLRRHGSGTALVLALVCTYRLPDFVRSVMGPFYLDLGFDLETIAEVRKGIGVAMLMLGVGVGGWSIARFGLMRSLVLLPWVLPGVVAAILWRFMYDPQLGLINSFLVRIGLSGGGQAWLAEPATVDPDRARLVAAMHAAFDAALASLEPRDRLRLACYHADGLKLAKIGKLLGEHEATVSRKLQRTRDVIREQVDRRLADELGLDAAQLRQCYEYAMADGGLDLGRLRLVEPAPDG